MLMKESVRNRLFGKHLGVPLLNESLGKSFVWHLAFLPFLVAHKLNSGRLNYPQLATDLATKAEQ